MDGAPTCGGDAMKAWYRRVDNGSVPWERELIKRLRVGHYQWRTE
jgi:hypothetical protein